MSALPLIVFDVNETLLDLRTMEPIFERIFGDKKDMRLWFANLVMYSLALSVADSYVPFTDIGSAVLQMMADTEGVEIDGRDRQDLKEKFSTMPPYPEVPAALRKLRALAPSVRLGYLVGMTRFSTAMREATALKCESVHMSVRRVSKAWARAVHAAGMKLLIYTVNTKRQLRRAQRLGVDGIFSDFPDISRNGAAK